MQIKKWNFLFKRYIALFVFTFVTPLDFEPCFSFAAFLQRYFKRKFLKNFLNGVTESGKITHPAGLFDFEPSNREPSERLPGRSFDPSNRCNVLTFRVACVTAVRRYSFTMLRRYNGSSIRRYVRFVGFPACARYVRLDVQPRAVEPSKSRVSANFIRVLSAYR